jgi:hypothetical protein
MARYKMWNTIKIQVAGQQVYASQGKVDIVERKIIEKVLTTGWRKTRRYSMAAGRPVESVARLLRQDGSPRGIFVLDRSRDNKLPAIVARFGQNTPEHFRLIRSFDSVESLHTEFMILVEELRSRLSLTRQQTEMIRQSWPNFLARYKDKLSKMHLNIKA